MKRKYAALYYTPPMLKANSLTFYSNHRANSKQNREDFEKEYLEKFSKKFGDDGEKYIGSVSYKRIESKMNRG